MVFTGVVVDIWGEFINGRMSASRAVVTIGEDKDMSCARKTRFNPGDLVLEE